MGRRALLAIFGVTLGLAGLVCGLAHASPDADDLFPRPSSLEPQIAFWTKVYAKYTTTQAILHDSEKLDIIYTVVSLPPDTTEVERLQRRERLKNARENIVASLERLAENPERTDLEPLDLIVQAAWGKRGTSDLFTAAKDRVRAQVGQADRFRAGIIRSGAYLPHMQAIMADLDLPAELLALPHVESSFDPGALSHRGASGIWQWTRSTGRQYMRIDRSLDERRDPLLATRAAGVALRQYYREFGSWPLAITAYNHGLQGMRRAHAAHGADIAAIVRDYDGRAFGFASRNFYTEFLAALDVSRDHEQHFGPLALDPPLAFDTLDLSKAVSFKRAADLAGVSTGELAQMNPALLGMVTSGKRAIPAGYKLRVPAGRGLAMALEIDSSTPGRSPAVAATTEETHAIYRVQSGDTLTHIARRFKTDVDTLLVINNLDSDKIRAGQRLLVPTATSMND